MKEILVIKAKDIDALTKKLPFLTSRNTISSQSTSKNEKKN